MPEQIKEIVKEKYGEAALRVMSGKSSCCCGGNPAPLGAVDPITANLYDAQQTGGLPAEAVLASLGCGNPTALAAAQPGRDRARPRLGRRASTCCSRRGASGPRARPTGST